MPSQVGQYLGWKIGGFHTAISGGYFFFLRLKSSLPSWRTYRSMVARRACRPRTSSAVRQAPDEPDGRRDAVRCVGRPDLGDELHRLSSRR